MKLSLSWIFDHIVGSWKDYDVAHLVKKLSETTAEVEAFVYTTFEKEQFTLAEIITVTPEEIVCLSSEYGVQCTLSSRDDVQVGQLYIIKKKDDRWHWATGADFYSEKITLIPAIACPESDRSGLWKNHIESEDYILHFDNKAITHRPDLWGHRGFAREIAAILQLPLIPEAMLCASLPVDHYKNIAPATSNNPFSFEIFDATLCKSLAGMYVPHITLTPPSIDIMSRLLKVDVKPINIAVDATNYVMFDLGQPLHAFDAATLQNKKIIITTAPSGSSLTLLDGQTIDLTTKDIIVTDDSKPLALAGIMGGLDSSVQATTTSLLVESSCFNAAMIRNSTIHHKKRTEASSRIEKNLDPYNPIKALLRFVKILQAHAIAAEYPTSIDSVGTEIDSAIIHITHSHLERLLGTTVSEDFIQTTLQALEFKISSSGSTSDREYTIAVPSFRSTKDVLLPEDIVEEIARFLGFENIPTSIPSISARPSSLHETLTIRALKNFFAFGAAAHEVRNYAFFDEDFLRILQGEPQQAVSIKNPVSEHWRRLVTSLIPHLIKNVIHNSADQHAMNFFEYNSVWKRCTSALKETATEQKMVAGIWFDAQSTIDFYEKKEILNTLFRLLDVNVIWKKTGDCTPDWFHPYQTAALEHNQVHIGYAGLMNPAFTGHILKGNAFIFEFQTEGLLSQAPISNKYTALPKYPDTWLDISMFVPLAITVEILSDIIQSVDTRIFKVELIDFFTKEEWTDKRAVTIRFYARDPLKTLAKDDIDTLYNHVCNALKAQGIEIR